MTLRDQIADVLRNFTDDSPRALDVALDAIEASIQAEHDNRWRPIKELFDDPVAEQHACVVVKNWRNGKRQVSIAYWTVSATWCTDMGVTLRPDYNGYEYARLPQP